MCSPIAMGVAAVAQGAASAIGQAEQTKAANRAAKRDYEYKNAIRKNRWMRELSIYGTKKVQFEKSIDESNIAAQRAYTQSQINYNRIRTQALFDQQKDFREMLKSEGMIEAQAAERGVRGKSIRRQLNFNLQTMGMANRQRARALTETQYRMKEADEATMRKLKSDQNRLFSKVAIQPTPDLPIPKPELQNPNFALVAGLIGAGISGINTYSEFKANNPFGKGDNDGSDDGSGKDDGSGEGKKSSQSFRYDYAPVGDYSGNTINYFTV